MDDTRPHFLPSFLGLVKKEAEKSGWLAIVPYALLAIFLVSCGVAYWLPAEFWTNGRWDISTAVYSGILTFNGLLLALGWGAFGRIYDVLLRGEFGRYLAQHDLLSGYLVHITFMHICYILAITISGIGLVSVLIDRVPLVLDRIIFACVMAMTIYSIKQAVNAVTAMNDLVWQSAFYEVNKPRAENVHPMRGSG